MAQQEKRARPVVSPAELFRQNVKTCLEWRELKYEDLVARLTAIGWPMSVATLSKMLTGKRKVFLDDLFAFSLALRVNPVALMCAPTMEPLARANLDVAVGGSNSDPHPLSKADPTTDFTEKQLRVPVQIWEYLLRAFQWDSPIVQNQPPGAEIPDFLLPRGTVLSDQLTSTEALIYEFYPSLIRAQFGLVKAIYTLGQNEEIDFLVRAYPGVKSVADSDATLEYVEELIDRTIFHMKSARTAVRAKRRKLANEKGKKR